MLEKKLKKLIKEASETRKQNIKNDSASYYRDVFYELSNFILKKLRSPFFKNRNAKIISNYIDEILQFIVMSNIDIFFKYAGLLIDAPNFKEKFVLGLKKYPYKNNIENLFYIVRVCIGYDKYNSFLDRDILNAISTLKLGRTYYLDMLNNINEENQKLFLNLLVENKADIPYSSINYRGNNKQIIFENIFLFMKNSQNLYDLMAYVEENPTALSKVKEYIDNNEEQAINSIFCEAEHFIKITDPTLKEIIKLLILEVMKNENVKFSEITYKSGGFSLVLLIGDKVIKIGDRITKTFPNNPYIIAPLLRKEFKLNGESCFIEITERVDTSISPSYEELYQLYKNLRDLGLICTDIKSINVGRLRKENIIHWNEDINPSEEVLGLKTKRGDKILKEGDLVILDSDFIYDEKDTNINYANNKGIYSEFEERYQREKKDTKKGNLCINTFDDSYNYDDINKPNFHK